MRNIDLTFIVPVYNAEKYIGKCLDSIINQTLKKIEIICINDGSTDNSLDIMKSYEKQYPNKLKVYSQQNCGVWKTRKNGIEKANGKYICFIDADDIIDKNYGLILFNKITKEKADIAVCAYIRENMETNHILCTEMNRFNGVTINVSPNEDRLILINTSLWNKVFKADLLKKHPNIDNPPKIAEDAIFLLLLYPNIKNITFTDKVLYHYKVHSKSAMSNFSMDEIEKIKNGFLEVKKYYESSNEGKRLLPVLDLAAFVQLGIAVISRFPFLKYRKYNDLINDNYQFLNKEFSTWKKAESLKFSHLIKTKGRTSKLFIIKWVNNIRLLPLMFKIYNFVTTKLKIDIKW